MTTSQLVTLVRAGLAVAALILLSTAAHAQTLYFLHADHLNTPRLLTDQNQAVVWRWDQTEPFGNSVGVGSMGRDGFVVTVPLRHPGQYLDKETNLNYNYFRDYDPAIGRYVQSDPIGLRGGVNTYAYVNGNPLSNVDPLGTDLVLITGGVREQSNPFGHSAIAIEGSGLFSYGNSTPLGSSVLLYLQSQGAIRNQVVTIIPTTPEQDAAVLEFFRGRPGFNSVGTIDNCTVRSNEALSAAGVFTRAYPFPGSLAREVMKIRGAQTFTIPKGGEIPQTLFNNLQRFAPPNVP